eukprot:Opistho-2@57507
MVPKKMTFPKEIIWLNGAPGSGKGTNTPFILKARGISAAPLVMSDLLKTPEFQTLIDRGEMIGDVHVVGALFRTLLQEQYQLGALVDGFPRTAVQVECIKLLHDKMMDLRKRFFNTDSRRKFRRPIFRIAILYVSEKESLERQLKRGQAVREHNQRVLDSGYGQLLEERATDFDEKLIKKRYQIFKEHYHTLLALREHFPFHLINAQGSIEKVQDSIVGQFEYQSSLELNQRTYDVLQQIPLAAQIGVNARQELVRRLDNYQKEFPGQFERVVSLIDAEFIPVIKRNAFAGSVLVRSENALFLDPYLVDMAMDVLAERGFKCRFDEKIISVPETVDPDTYRIKFSSKRILNFFVEFPAAKLRNVEPSSKKLIGNT